MPIKIFDGIRPVQLGAQCVCLAFVLLASSMAPAPARAGDEQDAAKLLAEAEKLYTEVDESDGMALPRRIKLLGDVLERLDRIVDEYPGSRTAVELATGQDIGYKLKRSEIDRNLRALTASSSAKAESDANWEKCPGAPTTECILDQMLVLAGQVGREFSRRYVLSEIIVILAQSGWDGHARMAYAELLIDLLSIEFQYARDIHSATIVSELARADWFREARILALRIVDQDSRDQAMGDVAAATARASRYDESIEITFTIKNENARAEALAMISNAAAKAGEMEKAEITLARAVALTAESKASTKREYALLEIGRALLAADRLENARRHLDDIYGLDTRTYLLREFAMVQADRGQFDQAYETARSIQNTGLRSSVLIDIFEVLAISDRHADAIEKIAEYKEDLDPDEVTISLTRIAAMNNDFGKALEYSKKIENELPRIRVLQFISEAMRENGLVAEADKVLDAALKTARSIIDNEKRTVALGTVAGAFSVAGHEGEAKALVVEALLLLRGITKDYIREYFLLDAMEILVGSGRDG